MAQTNYTPIQLYSSSTATNTPLAANLAAGELAINTADGILFYKDSSNVVQKIGYKLTPTTAGGTGLTSFTANGVVYASSTSALATGSALVFDGTNLGVGVSPTYKLDVSKAAAGDVARFTNGGASNKSLFVYTDATYAAIATGVGASGNGIAFDAVNNKVLFTTASTNQMFLDASGNLGLGVTPSAWTSIFKAVQVKQGSISTDSSNNTTFANNCYFDGANWKYINTAASQQYLQYAGLHIWNTALSGTAGNAITFTQAMTLDASGNLGIGATSPGAILDIRKAASGTVGPTLSLINSATSAVGNAVDINMAGNPGGGALAPTGRIRLTEASGAVSTMSFWTYNGTIFAERMSLDPNGNLLVGTTGISTGSFKGLQVGVNAGGFGNYLTQNPAGTSTRQWNFGMNSSDQYVVYGYNNTTFNTGAYIAWGGTSWTAQSDERKKDIIEPIADAMTKVSTLRAVIGKYKTDVEGTRRSFLIAQDVQAVLPEAVDASNPDDLGVQYTEVIPLLVAAIKEQSALITQLTARITALEGA
jgi:hypothetical protein